MKPRYVLIGGRPFSVYTGTTTFTNLLIKATANNEIEMKSKTEEFYEECSGLMLWIDLETGAEPVFEEGVK